MQEKCLFGIFEMFKHNFQWDRVLENFKCSLFFDGITLMQKGTINRLILTYKRERAVRPVKSGTDFNRFLCSNLERKHKRISFNIPD